jgi:hypothetical protein
MPDLHEYRQQARSDREYLAEVEATLEGRRNVLRRRQDQLARALRQGEAESETARALAGEIEALTTALANDIQTMRASRSSPTGRARAAALQAPPWELVNGLSDRLPFLFLPVRIETRFMTVEAKKELWVRIFPDDIAVHTHEQNLTTDEMEAGKSYWRENWRGRQEQEAEARQAIEKGAWRALAEAYGGPRAAWIARQTRPASLDVPKVDDLQFPQFPEESLKAESWSRAPRAKVMPDRFVVMGFLDGREVFRQAGNPVPDPLSLGPNPQAGESEFQQTGGELSVAGDVAWLYDFEKAVELGMGLKIPLAPPVDSRGLSQLLVLGLRLSTDEGESQALVEELLENHSYSPDGLSLVLQGTPTNNTSSQGSGFSSVDPGAEASFTVETDGPLFEPVDAHLEKRDGQRLAEALGIGHEFFQRIPHAEGTGVREALLMNRALWSGTVGYYLDEMLNLSLDRIEQLRSFFLDNVTGRGPVPALRASTQPYGLLLTSDFSRWKWSSELDAVEFSRLEDLYNMMAMLGRARQGSISRVARMGGTDDPFQDLLNTLGLQASSVEFYRRHAVGPEYLWNFRAFTQRNAFTPDGLQQRAAMMRTLGAFVRNLSGHLEIDESEVSFRRMFRLSFFEGPDLIPDPRVDDIPAGESEKLSETKKLRRVYRAPDPDNPGQSSPTNYIGWLAFSPYQAIRDEGFAGPAGDAQAIPRPLLYRLLRASLLQAVHDAALRLYTQLGLVPKGARREVEVLNVQESRTVTRWEFLDADISAVMPQISQKKERVAEFLLSDEGLSRPEAKELQVTIESIRALADLDLSTAQLERGFVEHIDLCSYRLDAWQTGCFNRRLQQQRFPAESGGAFGKRVQGLYLGAFGWVEALRPAPEPVPVDPASVPTSLNDPQRDGPLFEQPDNAGFIHAPSLDHAVTAAVLRSAYLTHFDPHRPERMAINLSSERVRIALDLRDGVCNGQELGALLGYQFERGLQDGHGDPSLSEFIPNFRQAFPLTADKITPGVDGEQIETKQARNVFDGYALLESTFLRESPLIYPYGVPGLPIIKSDNEQDPAEAAKIKAQVEAIQAEVERMADSLDAIADLALAEGVYQATQGNFERAGAMLKAMTQGESPAEPEIVRTPRSGVAITQRVTLHLQTGAVGNPWPGLGSRKAEVERGLNAWLGGLLPGPGNIRYTIHPGGGPAVEQNLLSLGLQPIDLVYLISDDLAGETTELESRITFESRRQQQNDALEVRIDFTAKPSDPADVTLFELLPLLRALRRLITSSRPLGAGDYGLPSEVTNSPDKDPNPQGLDPDELKGRVQVALARFTAAVTALKSAIPAQGPDGQPNAALADADKLRAALRTLADFGVPDAFPLSAFGGSGQAKSTLIRQGLHIHAIALGNQDSATKLKTAGDNISLSAEDRVARYRSAAQAIFGPAFNLIPSFNLKNQAEMLAAANFRDADPPLSLARHHQGNPLIVEEWLEGAARVQPNLDRLQTINVLGEIFGNPRTQQKPIQLPFRSADHWVAVEYPEAFVPEGEFLSILQVLPATGFALGGPQSGLLIDEWVETIPSKSETTGIAFHFNQPNTEPPQVCMLAVTPEITGTWTWDKLVGILQDTFTRMKLRAVEPDQLQGTAFEQLLPAVVDPVATRREATITADLVYQTATAFSG